MADNNQNDQQQQGKNKGGGGQPTKGLSLNSGFDASSDEFNLSNTILGAVCNGFGFIAAAGVAFLFRKQMVKLPWFKGASKPTQSSGFSFDQVNEKSGKSLAAYLAKNNPQLAADMAGIITNIQGSKPQDVTPLIPPTQE